VRQTAKPRGPGVLVITALAVIALPVITALTMLLAAPPAGAQPDPGRCQAPSMNPACQETGSSGTSGGGTGVSVGLSVTVGGGTPCPPSGIQVSLGVSVGGSVRYWVPGPCPAPAPAPKPARTTEPGPARPARPHARRPAPKVLPQVPAVVVTLLPQTAQATQPRPHRPVSRPRPAPRPRPAVFQAALEGEPATTYTPGRPVMPIGVLITVVLTPCVITMAARLGRLLSGR
jgi:hypothetical protein